MMWWPKPRLPILIPEAPGKMIPPGIHPMALIFPLAVITEGVLVILMAMAWLILWWLITAIKLLTLITARAGPRMMILISRTEILPRTAWIREECWRILTVTA